MYEQPVPVRARITGHGNGQASGPLSQHPPFCGPGEGVRYGYASTTPYKWSEGIETLASTDIYENPEAVKLEATELSPQGAQAQQTRLEFVEGIDATNSTPCRIRTSVDRTYQNCPSDKNSLCSFIGTHRSCLAAAFAVVVTLLSVGLAFMVFTNGEEISELSNTIDALKRNLVSQQNRTANLKQRLDQMPDKKTVSRPEEYTKRSGTPASCPDEYTKWRGLCYKAFNASKNFWQADLACHDDGGTLAMPRDNDTNAFLISLYKTVSNDSFFWFGLHDEDEEGNYEWVDGTALGKYSSWATGQPNNYLEREDCVAYSASQINSTLGAWVRFNIIKQAEKWYDRLCYSRTPFLCQVVPQSLMHRRH